MKFTQAEKDRLTKILFDKHESTYQIEAFVNLVILPLHEVNKITDGNISSDQLLGKVNRFIEDSVRTWVENHRDINRFTVEQLLWSVCFNDGIVEFDVYPEILNVLEAGKANVKLFNPSAELLDLMMQHEAGK
jgi:hypothetical protein